MSPHLADCLVSRVKARIGALAEKTTSSGCTEAEALSAADMVGRLLERYALTMEQVDLRETFCSSRCSQVASAGARSTAVSWRSPTSATTRSG